jgi:uncharacterized lipoprotein YddW (UPF0748 family)
MTVCGLIASAADLCPVGDLNGDCHVDIQDLVILTDDWLWRPDYPAQKLVGFWKLDESSGLTAYDSSPDNHPGMLINGPAWLPAGGRVNGCLHFDGINDYANLGAILSPADGPFTVSLWFKGGATKETLLGQTDGSGFGREWLQIDPSTGYLMTRLTDGIAFPLTGTVLVNDSAWHHAALVWNGSKRKLFVDGNSAGQDASALYGNLLGCRGSLYLGASKGLESLNFWSGLIDEVRIYSRALSADEIGGLARPCQTAQMVSDFNCSDGVDFGDLAILASNWMMGPRREYRCIWADSWNPSFLNQSQAQELVNTCRDNNINTIIVEVRKTGDAYYTSLLEPRATNISGGSSFDPLGYLIQLAHDTTGGKKYVEVHAWFVMQRIAKTGTLPAGHVLLTHPEYKMLSRIGGDTWDSSKFLDPGHPGAVNHNIAVILDCMSKYNIDGVNLDYIRYPGTDSGYNAVSLSRFHAFTGRTDLPAITDPQWSDWRRDCVTREVKKIYVKMWMSNPGVILTADTITWGWGYDDYYNSSPYNQVYQDWVGWLQAGIIDYNTKMGYVYNDPARYQGWSMLSLNNDDRRGSIISTGAYMQHTVQQAIDQLLCARSWGADGLNIYDWGSEVNANDQGETRADFYRELKNQVYPHWSDTPIPQWKARPTTGIVEGDITCSGLPVDHAWICVEGDSSKADYSDGSGWFGLLDLAPGSHVLRVSAAGCQDKLVLITIPSAGDIVSIDIALTPDP